MQKKRVLLSPPPSPLLAPTPDPTYSPPIDPSIPPISAAAEHPTPSAPQGFLSKLLFGAPPSLPYSPPRSPSYPGPADELYASQFDQTYGTSGGGIVAPGMKMPQLSPRDLVDRQDDDLSKIDPSTLSPTDKSSVLRNWLGAQRDAISALGFDPRHQILTHSGHLTHAGQYFPESDTLWYDQSYNGGEAAVHESIHRGLQLLRQNGGLPKATQGLIDDVGEETFVRLLMTRNFNSGVEQSERSTVGNKQVQDALDLQDSYLSSTLDTAMNSARGAASALLARRHPGGPR